MARWSEHHTGLHAICRTALMRAMDPSDCLLLCSILSQQRRALHFIVSAAAGWEFGKRRAVCRAGAAHPEAL